MIQTADRPYYYYPCITIHPDEVYTYSKFDSIVDSRRTKESWRKNFECNRISAELSEKSKRKIHRAIKYMLFYSNEKLVYRNSTRTTFKFKVAFITLTLPAKQIHTDNEIKELCLNQFLIEAKKKWNMRNYIWKAEKQANGNIHFHILIDTFIPYQELRNVWNRIINKLGYVDRYRQIHHKLSPNSTDIHSLKKVKNVYSYISKYFKKERRRSNYKVKAKDINYTRRYIGGKGSVSSGAKMFLFKTSGRGRIYGTSYSLSKITGVQVELSDKLIEELEKIKRNKNTKSKDKEYISCYFFRFGVINEKDTPIMHELLSEYVKSLLGTTIKMVLPKQIEIYETV